MESLISTTAVIIGAILLYRYRAPLIAVLHRFDARNRQRIEEEISDRRDPVAHYKHTFRVAEEQVEEVNEIEMRDTRTGEKRPCTRRARRALVAAACRDRHRHCA